MTEPIRTERLVLRPVAASDARAIAEGLADWQVTRWLTVVPFPYAIEDAHDFLRACAADPDDATWAIDAGQGLIGVVSAGTELGYWLSSAHHGSGIMTEAAGAVVDWHFSSVSASASASAPLRSGFHLGNSRSARVLQKLKFEPGEVEAALQVSTGKAVDIQRMWLTRDRWERLRNLAR